MRLTLALLTAALSTAAVTTMAGEAESLYAEHCAACHGGERLGGMGPALLPANLRRLRPTAAAEVIRSGRPQTQMPAFAERLTDRQIELLAELIYTPPETEPVWSETQITASHVLHAGAHAPPVSPVHQADPLNLFVVVELGDHHVSVLDGDRLEPIHRFASRFALHGGPKFSPDGRYVYFGSRDGWVSKFDLHALELVAETRAGINLRNIAVSADGRLLMAANYLPHTLVLLDADKLELLQVINIDGDGGSSRASAVYTAPPRQSFVVALKDLPEIWEISYASAQADGTLPVRRIALDDVLDDFFFDQDYRLVLGASRDGGGQVVDLDAGQPVSRLDLAGLPHLGSGISWQYDGRTVLATPNLREARVSIIDLHSFDTLKVLDTLGPGFFMRSHEQSRYAWVDVFFGPHKDAVHVIDKSTLEIVATLRPTPGKTAAHVEFTRDGSHALVSVWENDGELVVYDADSLEIVKRLPMRKPSGKYNVWNKITRSAGTSH